MSSQLFVTIYTLYINLSAHKQFRRHLPNHFREFPCILFYLNYMYIRHTPMCIISYIKKLFFNPRTMFLTVRGLKYVEIAIKIDLFVIKSLQALKKGISRQQTDRQIDCIRCVPRKGFGSARSAVSYTIQLYTLYIYLSLCTQTANPKFPYPLGRQKDIKMLNNKF